MTNRRKAQPTLAAARALLTRGGCDTHNDARKHWHEDHRIHARHYLCPVGFKTWRNRPDRERLITYARIAAINDEARTAPVFVGHAAALLHGFDLPGEIPRIVIRIASRTTNHPRPMPDVRAHATHTSTTELQRVCWRLPATLVTTIGALQVPTIPATAALSALHDPPELSIVIIDEALRRMAGFPKPPKPPGPANRAAEAAAKDDLVALAATLTAFPSIANRAAEIIHLADAGNTNFFERREHHQLLACGVPEVLTQVPYDVPGASGVADFLLRGLGRPGGRDIIFEADGRGKMVIPRENLRADVLDEEIAQQMAASAAQEFGQPVTRIGADGREQVWMPGDHPEPPEDPWRSGPEWVHEQNLHANYEHRDEVDAALRGAGLGVVHRVWRGLWDAPGTFSKIAGELREPLVLRPRDVLVSEGGYWPALEAGASAPAR